MYKQETMHLWKHGVGKAVWVDTGVQPWRGSQKYVGVITRIERYLVRVWNPTIGSFSWIDHEDATPLDVEF